MKDRYPYLSYWKETGFQEFPGIPPEELLKPYIENALAHFRKVRNSSPYARLLLSKEDREFEEAEFLNEFLKMAGERFQEIVAQEMLERGRQSFEATKEVVYGQDRGQILRKWGRASLPNTRGGARILSENLKQILKTIHLELQECIDEVRRSCSDEIPLKDNKDYPWGADASEVIAFDVPDWEAIFDRSELPLLTKYSSISQTSLEIISQRLTQCLPRTIKPRSLQNLLDNVSPLYSPSS